MNDRSHLSIGEVLSLLQQDFPDVTISKIRFLESQGLLDPERTPSGYRKFYDADIVRLRWILRQQRENFLPLKVIKDRLAEGNVDFDEVEPEATSGSDHESGAGAVVRELVIPPSRVPAGDDDEDDRDEVGGDDFDDDRGPGHPHPVTADPATTRRQDVAAMLQEAPTPRPGGSKVHAALPPLPTPERPLFDTGATAVSLTLDELMAATGLTAREVGDLERFGMLAGRSLGSTNYYDEDALLVARLAAAFRNHGIEARHLRMYKVSAEREAGVFEQLLIPLSRKRSPQARREATELVNELADLGDGLRSAMLRMLLRDYLDGS